jgi:chromate transporter
MNDELWPMLSLSAYLVLASMMAIGGGVIMLAPDVHHYVVDIHHLISSEQFAAAFTIAQAAPGPNFLFVTLIGWQIGGLAGAIATTLAVIVPSSILTLVILRIASRTTDSRIARAFKVGMGPLSVGLLSAATWVLGTASGVNWHSAVLVLLTIVLILRTKLNPVLLIAAGAVAGLLGFV